MGSDDEDEEAAPLPLPLPPPPPVEDVKPEVPQTVLNMIVDRVRLSGLEPEMWTEDDLDILTEFIEQNIKVCTIYVDQSDNRLAVKHCTPYVPFTELCYFIRKEGASSIITVQSFNNDLVYGTLSGKAMTSMLRSMHGVFLPAIYHNKTLPDNIWNEFNAQLHQFMASLTDTRWHLEGETVLYVPYEGMLPPKLSFSKDKPDKEFLHRMETAMINWTRQINDLVSSHSTLQLDEDDGPLEEIVFWKNRIGELTRLCTQLNKSGVPTITKLLQQVRSAYVRPFEKLCGKVHNVFRLDLDEEVPSDEIEDLLKAESNFRYLSQLKGPCLALAEAQKPRDVVPLLPKIITIIRMIWINSEFYNTYEKISGMVNKVSQEIFKICCDVIDLERIFSGHVVSSVKTLNKCIDCLEKWKIQYNHTADVHMRFSRKPWDINPGSILAPIDSFIRRCEDLIQVCECQRIFVRKVEGDATPFPILAGQRGPEILSSLSEIEKMFNRHLMQLSSEKKDVLNIRSSHWQDAYNRFNIGVKDIEVMINNLIDSNFETVVTIEQAIDVLDVFMHFSARKALQAIIDKKTTATYAKFMTEMNSVKIRMTRDNTKELLSIHHAKYSGFAIFSLSLKHRLVETMENFDRAVYLPNVPIVAEARQQYTVLCRALGESTRKIFYEWLATLPKDPLKLLLTTLLRHCADNPKLIDINIDTELLKLFREIHYWKRLPFEIPKNLLDGIFKQANDLRHLQETIMLGVRDYNRVIGSLTPSQLGLFQERVAALDKKYEKGLKILKWPMRALAESFINECLSHVAKVQNEVNNYKVATGDVFSYIKQMKDLLLVSVDRKRAYSGLEFEKCQSEHRQETKLKLEDIHAAVLSVLKETTSLFSNDGNLVMQHLYKYIDKVDKQVEEALRLNVKHSLQEVLSLLDGDGQSGPNLLFLVDVVLDNVTVEFVPSKKQMERMIVGLHSRIIKSISDIARVSDILCRKKLPKMATVIASDPEILKIQHQIDKSMRNSMGNLDSYALKFSTYTPVWDQDKDAAVAKFRDKRPYHLVFDEEIERYSERSNSLQEIETIATMKFVMLDSSSLKFSIVAHCLEWQKKLKNLFYDIFVKTLNELTKILVDKAAKMSVVPKNMDELAALLALLEELKVEQLSIEDQLEPLKLQFEKIGKHNIVLPDHVTEEYNGLSAHWTFFQTTLAESTAMIKKQKEKFKATIMMDMEEFQKNTAALLNEFTTKGPFNSTIPVATAMQYIQYFRTEIAACRRQEDVIRKGLNIFRMDLPISKELANLEGELAEITEIWELTAEWDGHWNLWKYSRFIDLKARVMEDVATTLYKRLFKLSRQLEKKSWNILEVTKNRVDQLRRTMPLITDCNNPALRQRHWDQIQTEMDRQFDYRSDTFTLEKIIKWHFDLYAEKISNISAAATKELAIEQGINDIANNWESMEFDIVAHKDQGHYKLRGKEDIMQALEDNIVKLATMKTSRFVKAFEESVDAWEHSLSALMEVVDMIGNVQKQWIYLENIFSGDDLRKQLPKEFAQFDIANHIWKTIMTRLHVVKNAYRGGLEDKCLLKKLVWISTELEEIQKSLELYLETKRQAFPRFYFISSDDLIEIMGQGKNPLEVQPHLKKLFDAIKSLNMARAGKNNRWEASAMTSLDGELIQFSGPTILEGAVESWLTDVERNMRVTLRDELRKCKNNLRKMINKRDKWIKEHPGQMCISASQIQWTADVTKALNLCKERGDRKALKIEKRRQVQMLNKFSETIRSNLTKQQRLKLVALVTIEVHARDIIDKLAKSGVSDPFAFDWLKELRLYWDQELDNCVVRQTNTHFTYGYEYLGNSGRLVITPLTDRCYITLTNALNMNKGGSPKGPAGTGKTETVKDLGRALGMYVIVINCSEGLDYKSMGRMFSGLAQTGAWGCFDEFNRINIEVLSVVAQQIVTIMSALANKQATFFFEGYLIRIIGSCGNFITMNPGYAGRTELPDNLKAMFRPISMMVPDSMLIAEIMLFGEGFTNTKILAKKVYTLYSLAVQQLSKQDHYDFGLRALSSVLRYAGKKKRANPTMSDEELLLLSMKDMNVAKFTSADLPLFLGIVSDLFPGIEAPTISYEKLKEALLIELKKMQLQPTDHTILKTIQLYDTKNSRHSTMIVGQTLTGKTVSWKSLQRTLGRLCAAGEPGYNIVREFPLNPKALSLAELYGEFDLSSNEWNDGVMSNIMRFTCADEKPDEKWIIFDGPVDTLWIESMNSVMDDNKILTLINGERISMPEQVSLLFEVEDLSVASPATVSRCGMVYYDYATLGWRPYVKSWLAKKPSEIMREELEKLFEKYMKNLEAFRRVNVCKELVAVTELASVISLCKLFDVLATPENGVDLNQPDTLSRFCELWFQFSLIWGMCASVDEDGRKKLDTFIREGDNTIPTKDTVYEYFVDPNIRGWMHWEEKLRTAWKLNTALPFYKLIVPTVDTVRYSFLTASLLSAQHPVLIVGQVGTGKTSVAQGVLAKFNPKHYSLLTINMSARTSSNNVQDFIESRMEKRMKGTYVPIGGKELCTFMDDFNMPAKDTFGSQPPLELIKLWIDYGFWYDRKKQLIKNIKDMFLLAAMGPPGGGRTNISGRLQSRFNLFNMTFPQESQIKRIFGSMITQKLASFDEEVRPISEVLTQATIDIYHAVVARFLPTPAKIHYLFNLRDISRVFQGLMRADDTYHDTKLIMTRLWIHECFRVFSDRLVDDKDIEAFMPILTTKLSTLFDIGYRTVCPAAPPTFGDYLSSDYVYQDLKDVNGLKKAMVAILQDYNNSPGVVVMDLVLFKDAIDHISKIVRVIRQPRGNMLLIGIGGSGRQSLTRLASYICTYDTFQIEIHKNYRRFDFREDIKRLYNATGVRNKETVFLFLDVQVVDGSFLEDINNILSSGEVSNLYKPDEFEEIKAELLDKAKKEGIDETNQAIYNYLIERVRSNLHLVIAMSPVGDYFRDYIRMYPALVNCTTIDWFRDWPQDALLEVADKILDKVEMANEAENALKPMLASMFSMMHSSVAAYSKKMFAEMKRHNYVTPTNYLELVEGYKRLLHDKRSELLGATNKLKNGLGKIEETREIVQIMAVELEDSKVKVIQFQHDCDEFLLTLVQQKREADEQQRAVVQKSAKIADEEGKCKNMADTAQADLNEAMPAVVEALKALEALNKKDVTEIKSYGKPPPLVEKVMEAVLILRGNEPTWAEAKKQLGDPNFIKQLMNFDKDGISDKTLKRIGAYVIQSDFMPEIIGRVSLAAKSLCLWVRAMDMYARLYRVVEPKRQRMYGALAQLKEKQEMLQEAKDKLAQVERRILDLKSMYQEKVNMKEELRKKAAHTEMMMVRAGQLVSGLASERERWLVTVADLEGAMLWLVGDILLSTGFISYMGPFLSNYRDEIVNGLWLKEILKLQIPCNPTFELCNFMVSPTKVRDWNIQGLPGDGFSTENGVIVTKGNRWPLMIDPQVQAHTWIRNMEATSGLALIDFQMPDYMRYLENAIQFGRPVLLQNIQEALDPSLDPILNKSVKNVGGVPMMHLGEKDIEYNKEFRFYITTKLSNPHYSPEIASKAIIVNFAVKEQGLMSQLLRIVVRRERPDLEETKDSLVRSIADGKHKLQALEDMILRLLNETKGSLLDNVELLNTLEVSKATSTEVTQQLETAEITEIEIDAARQGYLPCAERASILFFVLNDMGAIDPMYQFALGAYIDVFNFSIEKSPRSSKLEDRIAHLNEFHTYAVYRYACRGLFERHKLLFSFHMCAKILEALGTLQMEEFNFFLKGGIVLDRESQPDNPTDFLPEQMWDNITELEKLSNFHGIVTSIEQYSRDWKAWYLTAEPEANQLPGEWENACNELQRMLIVRSLRPDRVALCVNTFIISSLGSKFIEPPVLDLKEVVDDSSARTPLIFVLSAGVDPMVDLLQVAENYGMGESRFHALSLGQGQAPYATQLIEQGSKDGDWVFLANCHLSLSWMPALDKIIEQLGTSNPPPHPNFRLWLSSSPHPQFPVSILQAGIKMTTEPPKGMKANMKRLYQRITDQQLAKCRRPEKYKKLLFALCFFHSVLIVRKKFLMLGWNNSYDFNNSDFEMSENMLSIYLDEYDETPWDALKFLVAAINYGGHVTDDWDKRLLITYIGDYFCEEALTTPSFKLSPLQIYYIPKDGPFQVYKDYVSLLPSIDHPDAFGQHANADIASQIQETRRLFETLLSLQPAVSTSAGEKSREDVVMELSENIRKTIPEIIDYENTVRLMVLDTSPLKIVLLQEIERYNALLDQMQQQLALLQKSIQGLVGMSSDLDEIFSCIYDARVPSSWMRVYPSMKPLASWTRDLAQRVEQFTKWASTSHAPNIFWISAFSFPAGFLTAVLQTSARANGISIDLLSWEFIVETVDEGDIRSFPKEGVLVKGFILQGAGWDLNNSILIEAEPMQLICPMPVIHFKPVEGRRRAQKGIYSCPAYYYPDRTGTPGRSSFVVAVDLKSGAQHPEHWIKRGTALLMSLDS